MDPMGYWVVAENQAPHKFDHKNSSHEISSPFQHNKLSPEMHGFMAPENLSRDFHEPENPETFNPRLVQKTWIPSNQGTRTGVPLTVCPMVFSWCSPGILGDEKHPTIHVASNQNPASNQRSAFRIFESPGVFSWQPNSRTGNSPANQVTVSRVKHFNGSLVLFGDSRNSLPKYWPWRWKRKFYILYHLPS